MKVTLRKRPKMRSPAKITKYNARKTQQEKWKIRTYRFKEDSSLITNFELLEVKIFSKIKEKVSNKLQRTFSCHLSWPLKSKKQNLPTQKSESGKHSCEENNKSYSQQQSLQKSHQSISKLQNSWTFRAVIQLSGIQFYKLKCQRKLPLKKQKL